MADFRTVIMALESYGLMDVLLPFLLIFTIVFATLQKTMVLGKGKKNFNAIVSLVFGLMVVIPHVLNWYPPEADAVSILNRALPDISLLIVGLIMVLILIGLLGGEAKWLGGSLSGWIAIIAFIIVIYIFGVAAKWFETWPNWLWWLQDPDTQALVIMILVFGVIIWYICREPTPAQTGVKVSKIMEEFGNMFKGGK